MPDAQTKNSGIYALGPDVAASGVLTLTGQPADTEIVTIDGKVYTFQTVLTDVDGNVLIGATASDSLDNLIAAITLGAGGGSTYAASTTLHQTVTAAAGAGDTMDATAKTAGSAGDAITTTTDITNGSWGAATLGGGIDSDGDAITVDTSHLGTVYIKTGGGATVSYTRELSTQAPGHSAAMDVTPGTQAENLDTSVSLDWPVYHFSVAGGSAQLGFVGR